jgi:hypothetical protein
MDRKNKAMITCAAALGLLLPVAAFAQAIGAGGPVGAAAAGTPNLAGLGSGLDSGVEVKGELYSKGVETPANEPVIRGQIGRDEYKMTLTVYPLGANEATENGKSEDESLRTTQAEFTRVMTQKTVRIVTDRALRDQLGSLISYGRPLEIAGSVTDAASPMLMIRDIVPPKQDVGLTNKQVSTEQIEAPVPASSPEVASKK